ncbi:unnamed protein product, partial [Closterium sp. NIES-53]
SLSPLSTSLLSPSALSGSLSASEGGGLSAVRNEIERRIRETSRALEIEGKAEGKGGEGEWEAGGGGGVRHWDRGGKKEEEEEKKKKEGEEERDESPLRRMPVWGDEADDNTATSPSPMGGGMMRGADRRLLIRDGAGRDSENASSAAAAAAIAAAADFANAPPAAAAAGSAPAVGEEMVAAARVSALVGRSPASHVLGKGLGVTHGGAGARHGEADTPPVPRSVAAVLKAVAAAAKEEDAEEAAAGELETSSSGGPGSGGFGSGNSWSAEAGKEGGLGGVVSGAGLGATCQNPSGSWTSYDIQVSASLSDSKGRTSIPSPSHTSSPSSPSSPLLCPSPSASPFLPSGSSLPSIEVSNSPLLSTVEVTNSPVLSLSGSKEQTSIPSPSDPSSPSSPSSPSLSASPSRPPFLPSGSSLPSIEVTNSPLVSLSPSISRPGRPLQSPSVSTAGVWGKRMTQGWGNDETERDERERGDERGKSGGGRESNGVGRWNEERGFLSRWAPSGSSQEVDEDGVEEEEEDREEEEEDREEEEGYGEEEEEDGDWDGNGDEGVGEGADEFEEYDSHEIAEGGVGRVLSAARKAEGRGRIIMMGRGRGRGVRRGGRGQQEVVPEVGRMIRPQAPLRLSYGVSPEALRTVKLRRVRDGEEGEARWEGGRREEERREEERREEERREEERKKEQLGRVKQAGNRGQGEENGHGGERLTDGDSTREG